LVVLEGSLKTLFILAGFIGVVVALSVFLLYQGILRFNYPSFEEFPVRGVDVSHHQGEIDWQQLKIENAKFAYIKASEGATFRDPKFVENWNGALKAGVVSGAYHYYTLCKPGSEQANNFVGALNSVKGDALPPVVDLEFGGNCGTRPAAEEFAIQLTAFLRVLLAGTGCSPVLDVTQEFYCSYVAGQFQGSRFWVRDIYTKPKLRDNTE
jgi:lysozyme